jgi:hypothetical protein
MSRQSRWYDAIAPATAVVDCGGEPHRVTWRRGKLVLEAHDLTAERTMLVFGGELCTCMRVLEMWVEQFRMPPDLFVKLRTWLGPNAHLAPAEFALPRELAMVLGWDRAWRRTSWLNEKQHRLLDEELRGHALAPLRAHLAAWKTRTGARVISACRVAVVASDDPPTLAGTIDRVSVKGVAHLKGRWVVDVWPRGVAVVDDAFVLELVAAPSDDKLVVRAARWEERPGVGFVPVDGLARLTSEPEGGWKLAWEA